MSIPNYITLEIAGKKVNLDSTSVELDAAGNQVYSNETFTKYVIRFSDMAMAHEKLLYRMNIAIYSFILKLVPSIILTVITGFLGTFETA
jgi:hypothetical protein